TLDENLLRERSGFGEGTPKCYIRLAKRSLESDPNRRPMAKFSVRVGYWLDEMKQNNENKSKS
ncbi:17921_t:CDS:1, partial [Dentiscutata erythropus]